MNADGLFSAGIFSAGTRINGFTVSGMVIYAGSAATGFPAGGRPGRWSADTGSPAKGKLTAVFRPNARAPQRDIHSRTGDLPNLKRITILCFPAARE